LSHRLEYGGDVVMNEFKLVRRLAPELLLEWLRPARAFLLSRGLVWSESGGRPLDCDRVAEILMSGDARMPRGLVDSLCLIQGMASAECMDALIEAALVRGLDLTQDGEPTPENVAVRAWLLCPELLQEMHTRRLVSRRRAFTHFSTPEQPLPDFPEPTREQLRGLEQRLNVFYRAWKRGGGARVFTCERLQEWWFVVRHGLTFRRQESLCDEELSSVCFRPVGYDILAYNPQRGQIRVHCCGARERTALLRAFGSCFFGKPEFFPSARHYTLAPVLQAGRSCLACAGVPGVERIQLTELEIYSPGVPSERITINSEDVFRSLESGRVERPRHSEDLIRATFKVTFARVARSRTFTIIPCNRVLYSRDTDSLWLQPWLEERRFAHRPQA